MAISTSAKWYSSTMQGAPSLNGSTANLIAMLDAVLVNGFNSLTLDGITVLNGVATASRNNGHGYLINSVVTIAGATPSGLNGEKRILSVTGQSFTFDAEGLSDGSATGTITVKQSPAGWSKPFSGSSKAVYRSNNVLSPRSFYRIYDYANNMCFVQAYEGMTDVDTGTGRWDNESMYFANGNTDWYGWMAWADDRTIYFVTEAQAYIGGYYCMQGFGDYVSFYANDNANDFLMAADYIAYSTGSTGSRNGIFDSNYNNGSYPTKLKLHKQCTGALTAVGFGGRQINDTSGKSGPTFPSAVDQGLVLTDALIQELGNGHPIRGRARGGFWVLAASPFQTVNPAQTFSGVGGLEGRTMSMGWFTPSIAWGGNPGAICRAAFDITGPWE